MLPNAQPANPAQPAPPFTEERDTEDRALEGKRIAKRVKTSQVKKVGEIIQKHPLEALNVIRNWLHQREG